MSALGYDPAPGWPEGVREVAKLFARVADDADVIRGALDGLAGTTVDVVWQGRAAEAFRRTLEQTCADLSKLGLSYRMARDALNGYAGLLEDAQAMARRAEQDAGHAVSDRDTAERRRDAARTAESLHAREARSAAERKVVAELGLAAARSSGDASGAAIQHQHVSQNDLRFRTAVANQADARGVADAAAAAAASAGQRLEAARRLAAQARELSEDAAHRAATRVHQAADAGVRPRNLFEKAMDAVQETVTSRGFDQFLDILSEVGDVLLELAPVVVLACAVVGLFGGPAGFAAGLALGVSLNRVMTGAGIAVKGTALAGRMAQTAYDPSQRDKLAGTAWDTASSALVAGRLFAGVPKGRPLTGGSGLVNVLRDVKRSLSYADNRRLSGVPRRYLRSVAAAPKTPPFRRIPGVVISGETIQHARTTINAARFGLSVVGDVQKDVELTAPLPDQDHSAWYHPVSPEVVGEIAGGHAEAVVRDVMRRASADERSGQ